ncbi:MAG TPA: PH domain-containing protein [Thermoplasmata archaeon]|nr:PH domain-containing protein [Thermoplasmata archaeon]
MSAGASTPYGKREPGGPGRWHEQAPISVGVAVLYGVLILALLFLGRPTGRSAIPNPLALLAILLGVFFARYASTGYTMDSERLHARRLFGSRSIPYSEVHRIELASLRELSPTSLLGGWGWRGRMWSAGVGTFDSVHTVAFGVLIRPAEVPLFVSPKDPVAFARELSRRVRSDHAELELGPGI